MALSAVNVRLAVFRARRRVLVFCLAVIPSGGLGHMNDHVATDTESLCEDIEPSAAGTLGEVVTAGLVVGAWRVDETVIAAFDVDYNHLDGTIDSVSAVTIPDLAEAD
jgi:hypothetical protein